jgi:molybdopterin synthase sulfur carrier subunit
MVVTVKFIGAFRNFSGEDKITLKIKDQAMLKEIVKEILRQLPKLEKVLIDQELEDPRPNALILVNGREISVLNGLETIVKDGDELLFIPIIHGG